MTKIGDPALSAPPNAVNSESLEANNELTERSSGATLSIRKDNPLPHQARYELAVKVLGGIGDALGEQMFKARRLPDTLQERTFAFLTNQLKSFGDCARSILYEIGLADVHIQYPDRQVVEDQVFLNRAPTQATALKSWIRDFTDASNREVFEQVGALYREMLRSLCNTGPAQDMPQVKLDTIMPAVEKLFAGAYSRMGLPTIAADLRGEFFEQHGVDDPYPEAADSIGVAERKLMKWASLLAPYTGELGCLTHYANLEALTGPGLGDINVYRRSEAYACLEMAYLAARDLDNPQAGAAAARIEGLFTRRLKLHLFAEQNFGPDREDIPRPESEESGRKLLEMQLNFGESGLKTLFELIDPGEEASSRQVEDLLYLLSSQIKQGQRSEAERRLIKQYCERCIRAESLSTKEARSLISLL